VARFVQTCVGDPNHLIDVQSDVTDLGTDSNEIVYAGSTATNSIVTFNPDDGTVETFVRDPRIDWTDTMSVSTDGYLYVTEN
jgi:hypothetical protein